MSLDDIWRAQSAKANISLAEKRVLVDPMIGCLRFQLCEWDNPVTDKRHAGFVRDRIGIVGYMDTTLMSC
jgi:hypothetical protein